MCKVKTNRAESAKSASSYSCKCMYILCVCENEHTKNIANANAITNVSSQTCHASKIVDQTTNDVTVISTQESNSTESELLNADAKFEIFIETCAKRKLSLVRQVDKSQHWHHFQLYLIFKQS